MPNWTKEDGTSDFGKLACKRCFEKFAPDKHGEIPPHACLGPELWSSKSNDGQWHVPVPVNPSKRNP